MICRAACSRQEFLELANASRNCRTTIALACCDQQQLLEPGTPARHTWIRAFADEALAEEGATALDECPPVESGVWETLLVPVCNPTEEETLGIPIKPGKPVYDPEPYLMLIEGAVSDEEAIGRYRNIIMPLIKRLGGRYLAYASGDGVVVRHGTWNEPFIALSCWPGEHAANQFWMGSEYQSKAIPARTGAGVFGVSLMRGRILEA